MSRWAAPTLSSKSALAPRFRGLPRPCQRLEVGRYHSPPHPTYLGGESPRYGGRGGPSLRPRVQGGAVRWTFKVPPWTRYLGEVPWRGGTWHFDLAFTIKHPSLRFGVAPGGPAVAGRPPRACRRSRGWGRPGGTLGGPAVGDSGPLPGPDRRAPKQANISSLTRLYTALQSAPPRALRHRCSSGIWNADPTLT